MPLHGNFQSNYLCFFVCFVGSGSASSLVGSLRQNFLFKIPAVLVTSRYALICMTFIANFSCFLSNFGRGNILRTYLLIFFGQNKIQYFFPFICSQHGVASLFLWCLIIKSNTNVLTPNTLHSWCGCLKQIEHSV